MNFYGFKFWGVRITPKFSAPPNGEAVRQRQTCFGGTRKVRYGPPVSPRQVSSRSNIAHRHGAKKLIFVFFVRKVLNDKVVNATSPSTRYSTETILV